MVVSKNYTKNSIHYLLTYYNMTIIVIYLTHPSEESAITFADSLLEKRMIACYTTFPVNAAYIWNGAIAREWEYVTLLKTLKEKWEWIKEEVETSHPYEIPCMIQYEVEVNESYEKWLREEISREPLMK